MEKITEEEVKKVIDKLPKNKATGVDDIPTEFLQRCGTESLKVITRTINRIYENGEFPDDFLTIIFIPIPKPANTTQCEQYRTISLIHMHAKFCCI